MVCFYELLCCLIVFINRPLPVHSLFAYCFFDTIFDFICIVHYDPFSLSMSVTFFITKLQVDMCLANEVLNLKFGLILVVKCYDCLVLVELFVIDFVRESLFHRKTLCSSNMKSTAKSQLYYVFAQNPNQLTAKYSSQRRWLASFRFRSWLPCLQTLSQDVEVNTISSFK